MESVSKHGIVFFVVAVVSLTISSTCLAQRPVLEGAASAGSGLSFGTGDNTTVVMASPVYMDLDIIFYNDERPKLEYVVGFQAELGGRVSAGIIPQLRLTTGPERNWMVYGLIGAPVILVPFTMFGVEVGGGLLWRANKRFGVFGEIVVDLFMYGSDLPAWSMVTQLDANLGIRLVF